MRSLTWDDVRARRLSRSHLLEPAPRERLIEVVRDVGGIHAQVMSAAELSIAARVDGITQQDVRDELWQRRTLVKTWTLRGTLHLHPADELPLWTSARRAISAPGGPEVGATSEQVEEVVAAIAEVLGEEPLLREELAEEVVRRVGEWPREQLLSGWGFFLGDAAEAGRLCYGPPRGTKVTFVRPDRWLGTWQEVDGEEALRQVCRRFLRAYGPGTPKAFSQWFTSRQFGPADARRLFEALGEELVEVEVEGRSAWLLAGDGEEPALPPGGSLRLLPQYDCYVMGFRERERFVTDAARERLRDHARGRLEGPAAVAWLLVDGVIGGLWERRRSGKRLELTIETFGRLGRERRSELEAEAERIGAFLDAQVALEVRASRV